MRGPYDDIINLPHPVSATRPRMSAQNRAAQFSPFAALTGYEGAILETARPTAERRELSDDMLDILSMKLSMLEEALETKPQLTLTYFRRDTKKAGGAYISQSGELKKIDAYEGVIVLAGGKKIRIADIVDIDSALFRSLP